MNPPADYEYLQTITHQAIQLRQYAAAMKNAEQMIQALQAQHREELEKKDAEIMDLKLQVQVYAGADGAA